MKTFFVPNAKAQTNGTSFHNHTFPATIRQLETLFGEAHALGCPEDKVTHDWSFSDGQGNVCTVYDWKLYQQPGRDQVIHWHIGAHSPEIAATFLVWITNTLKTEKV